MSERSLNIRFDLYSNKYGHHDTYSMHMKEDHILIYGGSGKRAECRLDEETREPVWTGHCDYSGNSFLAILADEIIHAPDVLIMAIEHAWAKWREGEIGDEDLRQEFDDLFDWIDLIAQHKPKSEFWSACF